jgi:hypothetical protein
VQAQRLQEACTREAQLPDLIVAGVHGLPAAAAAASRHGPQHLLQLLQQLLLNVRVLQQLVQCPRQRLITAGAATQDQQARET